MLKHKRPPDSTPNMNINIMFKVSEGFPEDDEIVVNNYLKNFAVPLEKDGETCCVCCEEPITAFGQMFGSGVAFAWDLAHGEARCTGCGWPARGMHYVKREDGSTIFSVQNFFLPYHPEVVTTKK